MNAYVTLVMKGDFYIPGALTLANSLKQTKTPNAIVCMVTDDVANVQALAAVFDRVIRVDYIRGDHHSFPNEATLHKYAAWENVVLTQHQCLSLSEYSKVCFLDSDVVVLRNMDSVFDLETPAGTFYEAIPVKREKHTDRVHGETVPAPYILDCLRQSKYLCIANCLLLTPGDAIYKRFMDFLSLFYTEHGQKYGFEGWNAHVNEQMITYFYCHELKVDWRFIGLSYQCVPWKYVDKEIPPFLYHYMSRMKPWECPENKHTRVWWDSARACMASKPHLRSVFDIVQRNGVYNVACPRRLDVQEAYVFQGRVDARSSLSKKIRYVNQCTAVKTFEHTTEGEIVDAPQGFGLFQGPAEGRTLIAVHAELKALFRSPERYRLLESYEGKEGLIALFWPPSSRDAATSLRDGLVRLRDAGVSYLANTLELDYTPLIMRVLDLTLESVMDASVEVIFYKAVHAAGLEQHIDNVTRTRGHLGPVCSIGFGSTSRCLDLLPSRCTGSPMRQRTYPGEMVVLDSEARTCWSHSVPYGCEYERLSVVIRPCVSTPRPKLRFDSELRIPILKPTESLCTPIKKRSSHPDAFTMYGIATMLYTAEESRYITWPWDAHTRNQHICDALRSVRKPVIWDAYAGVGGDTVQLLSVVARSVVHAIQTKAAPGRINRLQQNVAPFADRCIVHKCSSTAFIMRQKLRCDLLYLDPPWMEGSRDLSAAEMVGKLMVEVFDVLVSPVGIVCLKTRFSWQELNLENAELDRTLETAYFFHFFRLRKQTA